MDPFDKLPDEVYQLIFHAVGDCRSLVRCMAVSKSFREHSERVSTLSIVCPGQFTSYVDKLQRVFEMVKNFRSLEKLVVRVGQPKDEPPAWARCMRFAEIGSSVEKFIFMAAKAGEFSDFDLSLRGFHVAARKEHRETSSESETEAGDRARVAQLEAQAAELSSESRVKADGASSSGALDGDQPMFPDFVLRQVVAPSNDVLKRMVPVIVFAIVQGLDEFRDSVPEFVSKFERLKMFLLVDMLESVTLLMREHQIQQIKSQEVHRPKPETGVTTPVAEACEQGGGVVEDDAVVTRALHAEDERTEMSRHDGQGGKQQESSDPASSSGDDSKGKGVHSGEGSGGDRKHKGKEIDVALEAGESSSSLKNDDDEEDDEEVTSPLRSDDGEAPDRADAAKGVQPSPRSGACASQDNEKTVEKPDGKPPVQFGGETWRSCGGVYIHEPEDGRQETVSPPPYRRAMRNRTMGIGVRKRDRSADWLHENRTYKGLAFRRREESRALRTWRLGKAAAGGGGGGATNGEGCEGSYNARSILETSFSNPPSLSGSNDLNGEESSSNRREQGSGEASSGSVDPLGECGVSSRRLEERQYVFSQQTSEAQAQQRSEVRQRARGREAWREAWRETWSERLGRRARELRREMQSQDTEREGVRRERLRENARRRQSEIEREALRLDITFWRAEEVVGRNNYKLNDVSMCIATHSSKPLSAYELETLVSCGLAGPLLAATIALVNEQASFHNL